jgi:hypothetical protein
MSFWTLRWEAYSTAGHDAGARRILAWDIGRVLTWAACFSLGAWAHQAVLENRSEALRFMIAIATFGTFLASFVLSVMTTTGKRELDLMRDATTVRQMEDRLRWLLSDQLIMVVSALAAAACGLAWLGLAAGGVEPYRVVTAAVLAFGGLAVFNALRLPFQIWELQSSALLEERKRAFDRLNQENEDRFR